MYTDVNKSLFPVFRPRLQQEEKGGWFVALLKLLSGLLEYCFMRAVSLSSRQTAHKHSYTNEYRPYPIQKQQFISSATRIFLTHDKDPNELICLKIWRISIDNFNLYRANSRELCNRYVYEGLYRNRRFVNDVYLGIVPIIVDEEDIRKKRHVQCGQRIAQPDEKDLKSNREYALVMKYLKEDWRMDYQLKKGSIGTESGMRFLAGEIAQMHERLADQATKDKGTPDDILQKLKLNLQMLETLLTRLEAHKLTNYQKYKAMMGTMRRVGEEYRKYFEQRQIDGYVRYCHGDLKTANLWVQPEQRSKTGRLLEFARLYVLDCVDFNRPEFCYIDTLSDVAMLAIDIQMYVTNWSDFEKDKKGQDLVDLFLGTYLEEMEEKPSIAWALLEYYLTEKAIVFACMSLLYDNLPMSVAEKYLDIALIYAQKLKQRQRSSSKSSSRRAKQQVGATSNHSR